MSKKWRFAFLAAVTTGLSALAAILSFGNMAWAVPCPEDCFEVPMSNGSLAAMALMLTHCHNNENAPWLSHPPSK